MLENGMASQPQSKLDLPNKQPKQRKARVVWKEEEEEKLAQIIPLLRLEDGSASLVELCQRAQERVLPKEKRRSIVSILHIQALLPKIEKYLKEAREKLVRTEVQPTPMDEEEVLGTVSDELLLYELGKRDLPPEALLPLLINLLPHKKEEGLKEVVGLLVEQNEKLDSLLDYITRPPQVPQANFTIQPTNSKPKEPKKVRIAVVGVEGGNRSAMQNSLRHLAELRFLDKDVNTLTVPKSCDYVLLFTDWCGHRHIDQAVAAVGRDKVLRVGGGLTSGIKAVVELIKDKH